MRKSIVLVITIICLMGVGTPWASAEEQAIAPLYPARQDGLWGYIDRYGQWAIAPQYLAASDFWGPAALVERDSGHMLIDRQGRDLLAPARYTIGGPEGGAQGFFEVMDEYDRWSYYDLLYERHCTTPFNWLMLTYASEELIPGGIEFEVGYIRRDSGEVAIPPRYEPNDQPLFFDGRQASGWVMSEGGDSNEDIERCDIIHADGRVVSLPNGLLLTGAFSAGQTAYEDMALTEQRRAQGKSWLLGLLDAEGQVVFPPRYLWIGDAAEGYRSVCDENDLWGHIDLKGQEIVSPRFPAWFGDGTQTGYRFRHGVAVFELRGGGFMAINPQGNALFEIPKERGYTRIYPRMDNGMHWVEKDWRYGLLDAKGQEILPPLYSLTDESEGTDCFPEDLQPIGRDGLWGYVNAHGQIAIPLQYSSAATFRDGLARIEQGGKMGYIRPGGDTVWVEP